jgi:hypothetical protein
MFQKMMTVSFARLLSVGLLAVAFEASSRADVVFSFSGGTGQTGQNYTYGFQFTPVVEVEVDSLGFIDQGQDGLSAGHQVGIWTAGGSLLASATVTTADSTLEGPVVEGAQFRFTSIAPLVLYAGTTYVLGASIEGANDLWYAGGTNISNSPSLVTVSSTGVYTLTNFAFPNQTIGNTYAAGNFTASAVPEPSSIAMIAVGMGGLALSLRRRRITAR